MLDNTASSIAERAWSGDILLPDTTHEFYGSLSCDIRMHPEMSFGSTTVTYMPKSNSRRRVSVSMAYTFGRQHDGKIADIAQRIGESVSEAYTHALQQFYFEPKIQLMRKAAKFIAEIRVPVDQEHIVIIGGSQAHLYAMCSRLRSACVTEERIDLFELMASVLTQLNQNTTVPDKVAVVLYAGFKNYTLLHALGMEKRLEEALNITPVLKMLAVNGHPNIDSDVRRCIRNIEAYNNKEG